jgi:hypothetical protein
VIDIVGICMKHDLSGIPRRTPGWSPARLKGLVDRAALLADGNPIAQRRLAKRKSKPGYSASNYAFLASEVAVSGGARTTRGPNGPPDESQRAGLSNASGAAGRTRKRCI